MDDEEIQELDDELRKVLRAAGLDRLVDDVDATIAEGRSKSEKRRIDKGALTEELVAIEYTSIERYELLLDATRRAVVEPADLEESIEDRLLERGDAQSVSFVDPDGTDVRELPALDAYRPQDDAARRSTRRVDRAAAKEIDEILRALDPRFNEGSGFE